jgi:hypothetical protein
MIETPRPHIEITGAGKEVEEAAQ